MFPLGTDSPSRVAVAAGTLSWETGQLQLDVLHSILQYFGLVVSEDVSDCHQRSEQ